MADSERATSICYRKVLKFFLYVSSFLSYRSFEFNMENPYLAGIFGGFWDPICPKMVQGHQDPQNAFPCTTTRVLSYYSHM
jgi:hypothetical protein